MNIKIELNIKSKMSFITGTTLIICRSCGIKTTHISIDDDDYFCRKCGLYKNSTNNYYEKINKIENGYEIQMSKAKKHNIKAKKYYEKHKRD